MRSDTAAKPAAGLRLEVAADLGAVSAAAWDALVGCDNPFVEHAFLRLLETSGSVGEGSGWLPLHQLIFRGERLVGAAPAYLKAHSYGEYIFDWGWAQAAQRAGLRYYPKIVVGVPFTPATGPRLLVHPEEDAVAIRDALLTGLDAVREDSGASGLHVLFPLDEEAAFLAERGLARRATHQYHWRNDTYGSFDDFLAALRAPARKQIRRERRRVAETDLTIERLPGDELDAHGWRTLFQLYQSTSARKWGEPYLTEEFFEAARATVGHRALIARARRGEQTVAATLSFGKGRHLYGRYWGAFEQVPGLHFELCYYQLLEHAIVNGMTLVEAGAQGEHKLKRGFVPVVVHSAHALSHPGLAAAVEQFLAHERHETAGVIDWLGQRTPFRDGTAPRLPAVAGLAAT